MGVEETGHHQTTPKNHWLQRSWELKKPDFTEQEAVLNAKSRAVTLLLPLGTVVVNCKAPGALPHTDTIHSGGGDKAMGGTKSAGETNSDMRAGGTNSDMRAGGHGGWGTCDKDIDLAQAAYTPLPLGSCLKGTSHNKHGIYLQVRS